jgi:hypothetical protein
LKFVPGMGLLSLHGYIKDGFWETTASTLELGSDEWVTHEEIFNIGLKGVHICDPSILELSNGSTMLSVSVDQDSISTAFSPKTLADIFTDLIE